MSREGRSQPIQPFAGHGFLGNTPANGVLPPAPTVVPLFDERRRQVPPLPAFVFSGATIHAPVPPPNPPAATVVPIDQRGRSFVIPPATAQHGFVDPGPGPVGTTPPRPVVLDRVDQRVRYRPLDPILLTAAYQTAPPPAATPTAPFVVPVDDRRRFLAAIPPTVIVGFDDPDPPAPNVVSPEDRRARFRPLDPISISGGILAGVPPTFVPPPGPFVVPIEERRYILDRLRQPTSTHGFVGNTPANGVLPPAGQNLDRADHRARYLPQPSLALSGVLAPFVPPPPVTVNAGTDWAAEMSTF